MPEGRRSFAVHSLLGHEPDAAADILDAAGARAGFFWLHDFASLCAGFHLLRNDVEDCAAPPADSPACGICAYGSYRARHVEAHRRLFERLEVTVVAPSETTLEFWRSRTDLPARDAVVLPHAVLQPRGPAPKPPKDRPFRIAYLGMPTPLKGWPIFRDLANAMAGDPRYEFLHLGGRPDPAAPAAFHRVVVTGEWPRAMQDTIEALEVDAALVWPLCRETFSFTAYEAVAGGAAVITGPDSGNVAAFASDKAIGRVLTDEAALAQAFVSGEILALGRGPRKAGLYDLAFSGMSGDLVPERSA
jgi:glycosyltransferase involved in cell wall biosynthesis